MPLYETPDGLPPGFATWKDPGHWHLHHSAVHPGPGDWTPYRGPDHVDEKLSPLGELAHQLAEFLDIAGPDQHQAAIRRGLEAGR